MKQYSPSFAAYLNQEAAYLPTCWKLVRQDGAVVGLTDFDQPLEIEGITYHSAGGFTPSDVDRQLGTTAAQISLQSYFSEAVTAADVVRGAYDNAAVFVFRVNPFELPTSLTATPYQYDPLVSGRLGRFRLTDMTYSVEARGLQEELNKSQGPVTSKRCRNEFCDSVCGLNIATYTLTDSVVEVVSANQIRVGGNDRLFVGAELTWLSGVNTGGRTYVIQHSGGILTLFNPPLTPTVGDSVQIILNCDKTFSTCVQRFGNGINFQGEPTLPGQDKITEAS